MRHCSSRNRGFCGVKEDILVARIAPHFWEEPVISGTKGSGTVFFSGCNLRCVYCQNYEISQELKGTKVTAQTLHEQILSLLAQGVHNINFVTPTHYSEFLAAFLQTHHYPVPIVYNCSGYESVEALERLRGKVDIFLPDFKYSDEKLARTLSAAPDYVHIAEQAVEKMAELAGDVQIGADGLMKKGVLIRHLMLPGQVENTLGVIDWFDTFSRGKNVLFSLMSQYTPVRKVEQFPALNRRLSAQEYHHAVCYMQMLGLDGFSQELDSADTAYIPAFGETL